MLLQIIGLWSIVAVVIVWFIRDEQKRRDEVERELAASYGNAPRRKLAFEQPGAPETASMWRQKPAAVPVMRSAPVMPTTPVPPTPIRQPVMSEAQLKFIAMLAKPDLQAQPQD